VGTDRGDSLNFDDLDCAALVTKQPARKRFSAWRQCQEARQLEQVAFPIGRTRAPTAGWLLVEGRRGHHTFCDEARAYHLATGSAYRIASCSGLALQPGGSVDHRATDRGRALTIEIGHLPVDALREAAWLLVLLDELEHRVVAGGFGIYLPKGMPVFSNTEELGSLGGSILGVSSSSADTVLSWRVLDADRLLKSGALTCSPTRLDDAEEEYAVTLLRVAEAGFVAGCPDVLPPDKSLLESPRPSAHRLDTDQSSLSLAVQAIRQGWKEAAEQTLKCSAPGSSSPPAQPSSVAPFPRPRRTSWL
jgi:hypothetical protein